MLRSRILFSLVVACLLLPVAPLLAAAQDVGSKKPPVQRQGPTTQGDEGATFTNRPGSFLVGDQAPDVDLNDTRGARFHLADARREKPWMLVFARTPDDLGDVRTALARLDSLHVGTVAIGPFRDDAIAGQGAGELRLLFDRANYVARTYGVIDPVTTNPLAGAFLVDTDGRIILIVSGGIPSSGDMVRMTRDAIAVARSRGR